MPQCIHRRHYKHPDGLITGWDYIRRQWQLCDQGFLRLRGKNVNLSTAEVNSELLHEIGVSYTAATSFKAPRKSAPNASPETRRFQQRAVRRKEVRKGVPSARQSKPQKG